MALTRLYQKLTYTVHVTRTAGEGWPILSEHGRSSYDVHEVEIEVAVYLPDSLTAAPVFDVRPVYATAGRLVRAGGASYSVAMGGKRIYHGRDGSLAAAKATEFEMLALSEAKAAYRRFIDTETERSQHLPR